MEWAHAAAVRDAAAFINDVNTFRPSGVRVVRGVAHVIDAEGQGEFKPLDEIIGDHHALVQCFRLCVADVILVLQIRFHLPFVGGMSFANVHGQEIGAILVVVVNLNDVADLAAKRRSSETPEDQHQRAFVSPFTDVEMIRPIEGHQPRVGRIAAHFQCAAMHVRKSVAHHSVRIFRVSSHVRQNGKSGDEEHA